MRISEKSLFLFSVLIYFKFVIYGSVLISLISLIRIRRSIIHNIIHWLRHRMFAASVMSFASGTVVAGWTPPATPEVFGETLFMMATMEEQSWIVSIYVIGALVGALLVGRVSQAVGLKRLLLWIAVPMAIGWIIIGCFVDHVSMFLAINDSPTCMYYTYQY